MPDSAPADLDELHATAKRMEVAIREMRDGLSEEYSNSFNARLIAAGLKPEHIADLQPITIQIGNWMGVNLSMGISLNDAIAEIDEVAGAPIETLLEECNSVSELVRTVMLKAAINALEFCCHKGRAVEAATFIIQTVSMALMTITPEQPLSAH